MELITRFKLFIFLVSIYLHFQGVNLGFSNLGNLISQILSFNVQHNDCKDIGIRKLEFEESNQSLCALLQ